MLKTILKKLVITTILFSSVSFFSILQWVYSPLNPMEPNKIKIGFPLPYYEQFFLKNSVHHGWTPRNLLIDFAVVLILILVLDFFYKKKITKQKT